jgi:excisionase family DNA binding protein
MAQPQTTEGNARWLSPELLANELDLPTRTIYGWRTKGGGPRGYRIGRHVRFKREDVEAWLETRADDPRGAA